MTNLGVSTQANGFWGALIKAAGYDAVVIHGHSSRWVYLHIGDGTAELRDATILLGTDTWEMEDAVCRDLGTTKKLGVFGIGPTGEHQVRFAVVAGDKGYNCSKNGCGAVMGAKRLKAVAVTRGPRAVPVYDKSRLHAKARALLEEAKAYEGGQYYKWGRAARSRPMP